MKISVETGFFKALVRAVCMNGEVETPVMVFKEQYMESINKDIADSAMAVCRFEKDAFLEYEIIGEEEEIAIEAEKTMKLIRNLSGDEVTIEKTDNSLLLRTENEKLKIPVIEAGKEFPLPKAFFVRDENGIVELSKDGEWIVKETIPVLRKELEGLGESVTVFEMKDGKLSVMQETTDGYSFQSNVVENIKSEDFTTMFNTDYLKNVFNAVIDDEVVLSLGKDLIPLVLENNTNNYRILQLLLPRVEYSG